MTPNDDFTTADRHSALWAKFEGHFTRRIDALRAQNDRDLNGRKTAEIRGRIAENRALLDLFKQKPDV